MWQKKRCFILRKWIVENCLVFGRVLVISVGVFALRGANRGSQCVFLPLFSHMNYIFNWGKGLSCHVGLFLCTNPKGCCFRNDLSGFLLQMSALLIRGFWHSAVRKHTVKHHSFVVALSFSRPWLYFHYSRCLISKFVCNQFTLMSKSLFSGKKKKKKRISFSPLPHVINVGFVLKCTEVNKTLKMYCYRAYYLTPFGEDV